VDGRGEDAAGADTAVSTGLRVDVREPLDRFELVARFETTARAVGIFGPSGAGKSTLLETIAGLRPRASGRIELGRTTWLDTGSRIRVRPEHRRVGYVPQDGLLFPHLDVLANVTFARARNDRQPDERFRVEHVLDVLELAGLERRAVAGLSGGERQRVALARALCAAPALLLLDEPLAGLDLPLRRRILPYLVRAGEEFGVPTLYVAHDPTEVRILCDEVVVLDAGRVVARGPADRIFEEPIVLPLATDEGLENVLRGPVVACAGGSTTIEIEPGLPVSVPGTGHAPGARLLVTLRPEDLLVATEPPRGLSARNVVPGVVRAARRSNGGIWLVAEVGRSRIPLAVSLTGEAYETLGLEPGKAVFVVFKTQACRVLGDRRRAAAAPLETQFGQT
jgi:molybdate transport system ATP-binding protein